MSLFSFINAFTFNSYILISCEDPNKVKAPIESIHFPKESPGAITFTDTDTDISQYGGYINVQKATDESDITYYVIYAGSDSSTRVGSPLALINKVNDPLRFFVPENTTYALEVTHLLAYSSNDDGLYNTLVSTTLADCRMYKVEELKNPASTGQPPPLGTTVFMDDLVVIAVMAGSHFWVSQNTEFSPLYGGINIYFPNGNLPSQGDVITLSGTYQFFLG